MSGLSSMPGDGGATDKDGKVILSLEVLIEGASGVVGTLESVAAAGGRRLRFQYEPEYRGPALSASLPRRKQVYGDAESRVFFDNLLPEGATRAISDANGRPFDQDDVVGLLSILGGECPGAVMVLPPGAPAPKVPGDLQRDYEAISDDEVERILARVAAGQPPEDSDRASLPGVQAKVAVAYDERSDTFLRAVTPGVPTTHLIKVGPERDPRFAGVVANEALCMHIARSVGFAVAAFARVTFGSVDALVVTRYDRPVSPRGLVVRLHQEDAAQALGLDRTQKYEDKAAAAGKAAGLVRLLGDFAKLTEVPSDTRATLRRAVFLNWLLGNNDAHMKNFSLLHPQRGGKPVLAPLYDIVSVEALPGEWRSMAMKMNGRTFAAAVTAADIRWLASLEPDGRTASGTAARARLDEFFRIANSVPGVITAAVHAELVSEEEAQPVRKLV